MMIYNTPLRLSEISEHIRKAIFDTPFMIQSRENIRYQSGDKKTVRSTVEDSAVDY